MTRRNQGWLAVLSLVFLGPLGSTSGARADAPVGSFIFPAGGQRGTEVAIRLGGLFLHEQCNLTVRGPAGLQAPATLQRCDTLWFEGPVLPLPDSQRQEDYPRDMAGRFRLAADAVPGVRYLNVGTAQGVATMLPFVIGELPEVVEREQQGEPIPVPVALPTTVNGRIFPHEDVDMWSFRGVAGRAVTLAVDAQRLKSPLDARLVVEDAAGRPLAESDDSADPVLLFTPPADGDYRVRIFDAAFKGGPAYVYRLTLTDGPWATTVFPLGGQRGSTLTAILTGAHLPPQPVPIAIPADAPATFAHRVGASVLHLDVDHLPEVIEAAGNGMSPAAGPVMLNGRIARPGEIDEWQVRVPAGDEVAVELRAGRLGSPLLGVIEVTTPRGIKRSEATGDQADPPAIIETPAEDEVWTIRVQDRYRSRGGSAYAYRLRVGPRPTTGPPLTLSLDALTVNRDGKPVRMRVGADWGGPPGPAPKRPVRPAPQAKGKKQPPAPEGQTIRLEFEGLPAGVAVSNTEIRPGQTFADVEFKVAAPVAAAQVYPVRVRGVVVGDDETPARLATFTGGPGMPTIETLLIGVALTTPFQLVGEYETRLIPRGTTYIRRYRIERNGYTGPLTVAMSDRQARHLQGAAGEPVVVPPGQDSLDYTVYLPPWMETGRTSRVTLMAIGRVIDLDGVEKPVSYHSVQQNDQMIAVIEPGRLGAESERATLRVEPGRSIDVPVRVARGRGLESLPAMVEAVLPTPAGVIVKPVTLPAGQERAMVNITFAANELGPFTAPVQIRATVRDGQQPIVAETRLTLLAPESKP